MIVIATRTAGCVSLRGLRVAGEGGDGHLSGRGGVLSTEAAIAIRIVQLGTKRQRGEGLRIGTVRRPPRGVPKREFAAQNWYDVWLPNLAPSLELMKAGRAARTERDWAVFKKKYRAEMGDPEKGRVLDLLAALSQSTAFSVGCYCEDESRCHRSVLRELLAERGARIV